MSRTLALAAESRLPVGSSARITSGSLASARAIATRWRWPPESWLGRLACWPSSPRRSSSLRGALRAASSDEPAELSHRQRHVVERAELGQQEVELEHVAEPARRKSVSWSSSKPVVSSPSIQIRPRVGTSSRPSRYSSDDLPEPDGPMMQTNSPRSISRFTSCTSVTGTSPAACA